MLKIVGMGYRGKLPGDKKREAAAEKYARELMALVKTAEDRSKKGKKK